MEFFGQVVRQPFAKGTKSERETMVLKTDQGEYVLRRLGGNPFRDQVLEELEGKTIRAQGELADYTLLVSDWEEA